VIKRDLSNLPNLEVIAFVFGIIETVEGDVFANNPYLKYVSFQNNSLTNVGPNILQPVPMVQIFLLNFNSCINDQAWTVGNAVELAMKLRFSCPPSSEMIERFILSGEKFKYEIDQQTAERINPAVLRIYQNEKRIDELEEKLNGMMVKFEKLEKMSEENSQNILT
jgi:hypothetical protein